MKCKCGQEILFLVLSSGKKHPVNMMPKKVWVSYPDIGAPGRYFYKLMEGYESHFSTCPFADEFRKGDKKPCAEPSQKG